ncbi:nuclear transport factor 2 family protein [Verrucosispora sp. WMMD1129]|uniref:nuclear transport factor 2 family protein n=1 Tax=Verrucosispora sp. WMMD1129 TaxID=3016093 RepID=UPI00249B0136|nr:nuclear transport factor 2 family protein [Verrucosispora sp. WMMD1129]WFE43846.1 nuclear transport factor 2 family protein [Verrucosispora sp. WMMD1129]
MSQLHLLRGSQPLSRLHRVHRHLPRRPDWSCAACTAAWPCPTARMLLRHEYGPDRAGLSIYLAGQLFDATGDLLWLAGGRPPTPAELFERFLGWAAPRLSGTTRPRVSHADGRNPAPLDTRSTIMDVRDAARRWADAWSQGWPARDAARIVELQAEDGDHWASMFRPYRGRAGLRAYVEECFGEETRPAEVWFGGPRVDGDTATIEYWAVTYPYDEPVTISGCTVVRFNADGLVAESRDYSHSTEGRHLPPTALFP